MKIMYMGKQVSADEFPEPEPELTFHFAPVRLTPLAINRASQHVPVEVWLPIGVYTWLQNKADQAWRKCPAPPAKQKEIRYREAGKRIEFVFERDGDIPVLKNVVIH